MLFVKQKGRTFTVSLGVMEKASALCRRSGSLVWRTRSYTTASLAGSDRHRSNNFAAYWDNDEPFSRPRRDSASPMLRANEDTREIS